MESPESVEHLCEKCDDYAKEWAPVAEEVWRSQKHEPKAYVNYSEEHREHPELAAFQTEADVTDAARKDPSLAAYRSDSDVTGEKHFIA